MKTVLEHFDARCASHPLALAVVQEVQCYTYAELAQCSRTVLSGLLSAGVTPGARVGVCLDRSMMAIAAMLAVWRAGAAFVPIDPSYPAQRRHYMIDDTEAMAVITTRGYAGLFDAATVSTIVVDEVNGQFVIQADGSPVDAALRVDHTPAPTALAYVMYTSGSTGQPKGVAISHRALLNYCLADADVYRLSPDDRTLQFSTLCFDIAIEEIFPPLISGGAVVIRPAARSEAQIELSAIVDHYKVTALHLATAYWHEWVDLMNMDGVGVPSSLRLMVVTGEQVSAAHHARWQQACNTPVRWVNAYGPTEATVSATAFVAPQGWSGTTMPIGTALPGYTTYVLDPSGTPVAAGETGELYIGGASLAEGYLNRPELTAEVFVPDPFSTVPGARMYRTGDRARCDAQGVIEYAGRNDHQLKIGSYRVEPGEIESALNRHPDILESLVLADQRSDTTQLLGYVVTGVKKIEPARLSDFLRESLPVYAIPRRYIQLERFPKTSHGKIDRAALHDLARQVRQLAPQATVAPTTDTERRLCALWSEVLNIDVVSIDDSFFALGGDSLLAIRAIASVHKALGRRVSTRDFFYLDTVRLLAGFLDGRAVPRQVPPPQPAFINTRGRQLYTLCQPASVDAAHGRAVLLVPPLGNDQRRQQRPMRTLMQFLARCGYTVLRFDWQGTGNSSSDSGALDSLDNWFDDIEDAGAALSCEYDIVDCIAVRFGALLLAQSRCSSLPFQQRIHWDPVVSGSGFLDELGRLHRGVLQDTYEYLFARSLPPGRLTEFAGLVLNDRLQSDIADLDFCQPLIDQGMSTASVIIPSRTASELPQALQPVVVRVDEYNNWSEPRATTHDMLINQAASVIVERLQQARPPEHLRNPE